MIYLRNFYIQKIEKAFNILSIVILIGARQVGKTTIMKSLKLSSNKLFLNGQDTEIIEIFQKYSTLEAYLKLNINNNLEGYLLIDEFQFIPGVSTMLKLLVDKNEKLKILCTGSSSLDILQNVEESLAGRVRIIEVFSLSFDEYLMFTDADLHQLYQKYDSYTKDVIVSKQLSGHLEKYMLFGGLPRVSLVDSEREKIELLEDIYRTYLMRDVRSYIRNQDAVGFNKLLKLLAAQIGNMVNVNELSNTCGLSYKKTSEYIYLLEQMYIIKLLEPFYTNKRKVITKMKKVYFTDLGMCNLINGSFDSYYRKTDAGSIFENYIFIELKRKIGQVGKLYFYRTLDGTEVDFVINNYRNIISLEVKNRELKKGLSFRNIGSLNKLLGVSRSYIVNKTLNSKIDNYHYIQGYFASKIDI